MAGVLTHSSQILVSARMEISVSQPYTNLEPNRLVLSIAVTAQRQ